MQLGTGLYETVYVIYFLYIAKQTGPKVALCEYTCACAVYN
jgi:hypothetical protein